MARVGLGFSVLMELIPPGPGPGRSNGAGPLLHGLVILRPAPSEYPAGYVRHVERFGPHGVLGKQSGFGREGGYEGIEEYVETKYVAVNL